MPGMSRLPFLCAVGVAGNAIRAPTDRAICYIDIRSSEPRTDSEFSMAIYEYKAVRIRQTPDAPWIVLFAAPATEIDTWAGVPQKRQLGDRETTGFQRELNDKRLEALKAFYRQGKNIIQNPLLCASRADAKGTVNFLQDDPAEQPNGCAQTGKLRIEVDELSSLSLLSILAAVKADIERRIPEIQSQSVPPQIITSLKQQMGAVPVESETPEGPPEEPSEEEGPEENGDQGIATEVMFEESHILEFWQEISARIQILKELGDDNRNEILGFTKEAMVAFLRPVVVVDGQHRLRAAVDATKDAAKTEPYLKEIEEAVTKGEDPAQVQLQVETKAARTLPVSLLLDATPAEHVFQFVVVNQKATPINRALLGTIVSTSLSNKELEVVSQRLIDAGIPLEESKAAAYITRHHNSPFYGLVERGFATDKKDLLPWSVLVSLVRIFRELRGGKLFHEKSNDYAAIWQQKMLDTCGIVADAEDKGFASGYEYWKSVTGPWREVFMAFWTAVRDTLANTRDEQAWNYWGGGRESNIFNKISLTILSADFFQYLCERKLGVESPDALRALVEDWLDGVDPNYFNRDWKLEGVKKDSVGIRRQWSQVWAEYRKNPSRLPRNELYRKPA